MKNKYFRTMKRKAGFIGLTVMAMLLVGGSLKGQVHMHLTLNEFLEKVRTGNIEYAAQRLDIEVADAGILSASVFNNPSFGFAYYNNELNSMQMGHGAFAEISQTFSPGRRKAAMNIANSEKELAYAAVADYFRMLREEAVVNWLEAVKLRQLYQIKRESYHDQIKMMESDSLSRGADYNRDLDILQNKVETGMLQADLLEMESELHSMYASLANFCGINAPDTLIVPEKKNIWNEKTFVLNEVLAAAVNNRADVLAAKKEIDISKYEVVAAEKERIPEFDIFFGYGVNAEVRNVLAPAPKFDGFEVGISFPIPIFDNKKGEIAAAEYRRMQAEQRYMAAEQQVKREVFDAYHQFATTGKRMEIFKAGLVKNAKDALDQKRQEYLDGDIHLIEVLDAQRSYDDILGSFYSVIYDKSQALVRLESAMGVWNIE
jgi:cobalt-zinc-cadmium efflux system outer membrane protein